MLNFAIVGCVPGQKSLRLVSRRMKTLYHSFSSFFKENGSYHFTTQIAKIHSFLSCLDAAKRQGSFTDPVPTDKTPISLPRIMLSSSSTCSIRATRILSYILYSTKKSFKLSSIPFAAARVFLSATRRMFFGKPFFFNISPTFFTSPEPIYTSCTAVQCSLPQEHGCSNSFIISMTLFSSITSLILFNI